MKLLRPTTIASVGIPAAVVPRFTPARDSTATGTAATQDVPAVGAIPETGGHGLLFPEASLLLIASILAYAVLRQRRRL
jgi:hypothetical protein